MNRTTMTTALATLAATALTGGAATAMAASADSAAPQTAAQSTGRSAAASDPTATRRAAVPGGPEAEAVRDVSATRINWGNKNGCWRLTLLRADITRDTLVMASAHEGYPGFIGDAKYTVHNVAPFDGGVSTRVCVDWGAPISLFVDYVIVQR